ncbi:hypothetical protein [Chitinophaga filiformis]|uniref:Uncharacterized protein n=1 Tax=Chitinophaga filiformis TaxID=104663 RepID=A0A1G7SKF6_CHIFI|nr:hypothetical protein [Chitinophaga filiformis]SDG22730.1 hypothetical protein SAMN04488121_103883 [Chitinophaga filiformis]
MKKLLLSSLLFLLTLAGWGKDPQRLALLPLKLIGEGLSEGGQLASFCIVNPNTFSDRYDHY